MCTPRTDIPFQSQDGLARVTSTAMPSPAWRLLATTSRMPSAEWLTGASMSSSSRPLTSPGSQSALVRTALLPTSATGVVWKRTARPSTRSSARRSNFIWEWNAVGFSQGWSGMLASSTGWLLILQAISLLYIFPFLPSLRIPYQLFCIKPVINNGIFLEMHLSI